MSQINTLNPHQQYKLAYQHLHEGRYSAGFRLFEWRWHPEIIANQPTGYPREPANIPVWQGQSLLGKSIVVQMEQGYGDQFMFARFLPALKMLGASKVVVLAQQSMCKMFGQMECIDALTDLILVGPAVECDYWIGSMSLPYYIDCSAPYVKNLFPVTSKKIALSEGYLHAMPSNIPPKIGVQWESSKNALRHIRTMKAADMEKLVGYDAYSLNPEDDANFYPLPDDGWKKDWSKTASHLKALRGLVTVDTGIAHLAGALGVKTIVLLPKEDFICWRWKNGRWYDSVVALRLEDYDQIPELLRRM